MTKTCDTCAFHNDARALCSAAYDADMPASARWMALEHLDAKQEGKDEDCMLHRPKLETSP